MTRTQLQLPDSLYNRTKAYADFREISMAEVFRNAIEMFVNVHLVETEIPNDSPKWTPPVCRSTGLKTDPFSDEDWRDRIYQEREVGAVR